ncbi:6558_t:CDS:2, partial [Ambispora leptoticha]
KRFVRSCSRRNRESGPLIPARSNELRDMTSDVTARQPSKHGQDPFTYSWPIRSFNELLYPNGVNDAAKTHISLYLVAIPTPYEKQNNITFRDKMFRLEVFRLNPDPSSSSSAATPILIRNETFTMKFEFDGLDDFGRHRFCSFDNLFPGGDSSTDVDLLIRVKIFNNATPAPEEPIVPIESEFPSFKQHLDDGRFSDVEFTFDCGLRIKAHRIILATRSSYFEKLLGDKWREGQMKTIPIKHMEYNTFRSILYYLYTGKLEDGLEFDVLKDVYSKADMLNLEKLEEIVADRIADMVDLDNWDEILMLAWEVGDTHLKEAALNYAVSKWTDIREGDNMKRVMGCGMHVLDYKINKCFDEMQSIKIVIVTCINESRKEYLTGYRGEQIVNSDTNDEKFNHNNNVSHIVRRDGDRIIAKELQQQQPPPPVGSSSQATSEAEAKHKKKQPEEEEKASARSTGSSHSNSGKNSDSESEAMNVEPSGGEYSSETNSNNSPIRGGGVGVDIRKFKKRGNAAVRTINDILNVDSKSPLPPADEITSSSSRTPLDEKGSIHTANMLHFDSAVPVREYLDKTVVPNLPNNPCEFLGRYLIDHCDHEHSPSVSPSNNRRGSGSSLDIGGSE